MAVGGEAAALVAFGHRQIAAHRCQCRRVRIGAVARAITERGAIVDGGIRDTHQIAAEEFPIFYRFHSSSRMLGRARVVGHRIPVLIGDTMVFPGDIVVADNDGALVVPRRIACDVLLRTEQVIGFETDIEGWVDAGDSPSEIVAKGGYF